MNAAPADSAVEARSISAEDSAWRDELSDRLSRYRARRRIRPPRYPSLRLQFEAPVPAVGSETSTVTSSPTFEAVSSHALALDGTMQGSTTDAETFLRAAQTPEVTTQSTSASVPHTARIIEFPRFAWGPPPPPPDQLAEPVSERPRILEAPEIVPPPPALGGITIEGDARPEPEKRPGIDIPLQSASLTRRVAASLIDGLIVAAASAFFGYIFWRVAGVRPPQMELLGLAVAVPALLWLAYQYLMIVYAAGTPGLRLANLELARFDGTRPRRALRRWRVLASYLSAASLGMGYAWVFLDEDVLCWHDRITHTYLAPKSGGQRP